MYFNVIRFIQFIQGLFEVNVNYVFNVKENNIWKVWKGIEKRILDYYRELRFVQMHILNSKVTMKCKGQVLWEIKLGIKLNQWCKVNMQDEKKCLKYQDVKGEKR